MEALRNLENLFRERELRDAGDVPLHTVQGDAARVQPGGALQCRRAAARLKTQIAVKAMNDAGWNDAVMLAQSCPGLPKKEIFCDLILRLPTLQLQTEQLRRTMHDDEPTTRNALQHLPLAAEPGSAGYFFYFFNYFFKL